MDMAFVDMYIKCLDLGLSKVRSWFRNFAGAPLICHLS
jgi:hypothetical protein